ncbi:hypothetical protein IVB03_39600 [Bradyrhizobium sp. 168]|uniref:hypothetical protein n=1 Tax=Bradyrhizobium sp. 168 TaxID=2782639 RepID=UPI001FF97529|nr:hypothetical protein [Bradyrhizobium sp. 168]MCK1585502.1 hypothetical protein [Bradyrhizobium sp. 168]
MTDKPVRIIKRIPSGPESIRDTGSFEVRFADGRESQYFYWDDNLSRRAVIGCWDQETAKAAAQEFARKESSK